MSALSVKLLVADDQPGATNVRIRERLAAIAKVPNFPPEPPWELRLPDGRTLKIECQFEADPDKVESILRNPVEAMQYDLILLDNDWQIGGTKDYGVKLLELLSKEGVEHPLLVLYTQHEGTEYVARAIRCGAEAVLGKTNTAHFFNVLLRAALGGKPRDTLEIDTLKVVTHDLINRTAELRQNIDLAVARCESQNYVEAARFARAAQMNASGLDQFAQLSAELAKVNFGTHQPRTFNDDDKVLALDFPNVVKTCCEQSWNRVLAALDPEEFKRPHTLPPCQKQISWNSAEGAQVMYSPLLLDYVATELCRNLAKYSGGDEVITLSLKKTDRMWILLSVANKPLRNLESGVRIGVGLTTLKVGLKLYQLPDPDISTQPNQFTASIPVGILVPKVDE